MQLLFLIPADAAQVADGKLYILGGGWSKITTNLPTNHLTHVAVGLKVAWNETDIRHVFVFNLTSPTRPEAREIARGEFELGRPPELPEGSGQSLLIAARLVLELEEQPGRYCITLLVDGVELGTVEFLTIQRQ